MRALILGFLSVFKQLLKLRKGAYRRNFQKPLNLVQSMYLVLKNEKGEKIDMKKKIALAVASLMLMVILSFAPTSNATWHGLPDVQNDTYIVTHGETVSKLILNLGPLPIGPLDAPFVSRDPWVTPFTQWQDINFSMPLDPDGPGPLPTCIVFLTVPWQSLQSLEHIYFSGTLGYTRVKLLPVPGSDGVGWLYIVPGIADVDIYVNNTYSDPYSLAIWTSPSPTPGAVASPTGGLFDPFPDPGLDLLPGFCPMGPGTQDDGFGDGVPDPAGSSVLFIPMQLSVEAWNGTHWDFQFGGPWVLPLTTGTASDTVTYPPVGIDGESLTFTGAPWENVASTGQWGANENKKVVKYAYAWSFIQFFLDAGPPVVRLDIIYGGTEKKVKDVDVIPDINCDNVVDVFDLRIAAKSFGLRDEGCYVGLYDPVAAGHSPPWPGPYPGYMPAHLLVLADEGFDARADVDGNDYIDIFDLRRIAKNYLATL